MYCTVLTTSSRPTFLTALASKGGYIRQTNYHESLYRTSQAPLFMNHSKERRALMGKQPGPWAKGYRPACIRLRAWRWRRCPASLATGPRSASDAQSSQQPQDSAAGQRLNSTLLRCPRIAAGRSSSRRMGGSSARHMDQATGGPRRASAPDHPRRSWK